MNECHDNNPKAAPTRLAQQPDRQNQRDQECLPRSTKTRDVDWGWL
jgi:hypothetical protein